MTRRAWSACSVPGCPTLVSGSGRCDDCQRDARRARSKRKNAGRGKDWQRTSRSILRDRWFCESTWHEEPRGSFLRPRATEVHHLDGLGPNGPRGHDPSNLLAVCKSCHSKYTAREQPGGWNDRPA